MERFIPNELVIEMMRRYKKRYPDLDTAAVELALRVKRFANLAEAHAEAHFARYDLTAGRFRILIELFEATGGLTPSALAEHGCVSRPTITGLLANLEKDGLVERVPGPVDGRSFLTRLSSDGRRKMERILPDHFRRMSQLASALDDKEQRELMRLLRKVEPMLQVAPPPAKISCTARARSRRSPKIDAKPGAKIDAGRGVKIDARPRSKGKPTLGL